MLKSHASWVEEQALGKNSLQVEEKSLCALLENTTGGCESMIHSILEVSLKTVNPILDAHDCEVLPVYFCSSMTKTITGLLS